MQQISKFDQIVIGNLSSFVHLGPVLADHVFCKIFNISINWGKGKVSNFPRKRAFSARHMESFISRSLFERLNCAMIFIVMMPLLVLWGIAHDMLTQNVTQWIHFQQLLIKDSSWWARNHTNITVHLICSKTTAEQWSFQMISFLCTRLFFFSGSRNHI